MFVGDRDGIPRVEWRRWRLQNASTYSNTADCSSSRDGQLRRWYGIARTAPALGMLVLTLPAPIPHTVAVLGMLFLFVIAMFWLGAMLMLAPRLGAPGALAWRNAGDAAGTLLGVSDVADKALFHVAAGGPVALISSPWLSTTVLAGVSAFVLSGQAFQERHAVPVTVCPSTAANITAMLGGIAVFGDGLSGDALLSSLQVANATDSR